MCSTSLTGTFSTLRWRQWACHLPHRKRSIFTVKRLLLFSVLITPAFAADAPLPARVEFNRDVRPILADTCFRCHGFDKATRKADLRLDVRDVAVAERDGVRAVVPGKPDESDLWKRIHATDEDEVMPPGKANRQLSAREKAVLKKWIEQGAEYQAHWAYIPPTKPAVPQPDMGKWTTGTPVDAFVRARHAELGPCARAGGRPRDAGTPSLFRPSGPAAEAC